MYTMVEIYLSPENEQLWDEEGNNLAGLVFKTSTRLALNLLLLLLLLLRASASAFTPKVCHAPISDECLFSMTLVPGFRRAEPAGELGPHPRGGEAAVRGAAAAGPAPPRARGRGLHSFPFPLNLRFICPFPLN
jgi:hypothetical protein